MNGCSFTVLVPTYRRPVSLQRCLDALEAQTRPAEQVVVVCRAGDQATSDVLDARSSRLPLTTVEVKEPGVVAAMTAGLALAIEDVVAITDDDAAPHLDWLERLSRHFDDASVAGAGGRDIMHHERSSEPPTARDVGRVQWFGRVVGNHHLGAGGPRDVDVLKGVNCAYRRDLLDGIGFDTRLRGPGAQVHWELSLGLALRRRGWRLVYDPSVLVDHYEAERLDSDRVGVRTTAGEPIRDAAYNEALVLLGHLTGMRAVVYLMWAAVVGTRAAPGLLQALRLTPSLGRVAWARWRAAASGRAAATLAMPGNGSDSVRPGSGSSTRPALSAVIIAQQEAERIERCIRSCWKVADEVVVVDGGSTDATPEIALRLGCKVIENPWPGYAAQRNVGVDHADGDWVLFVDADEEVGDDLAGAIDDELRSWPGWDAYGVQRIGDFMGRWMAPDLQVRLCRRDLAVFPSVLVHETIAVEPHRVGKLAGTLWHHGFRSIEDHVARFDRYTSLEADQAWRHGRRPALSRLVARPPARVAEKYLLRGLWRRGIPGLAVAGFWGYYEFLRELKLFERARSDDR